MFTVTAHRVSLVALVVASVTFAACGGGGPGRDATSDGLRDDGGVGGGGGGPGSDAAPDGLRDDSGEAGPDGADAQSGDGQAGADGDAPPGNDAASDGDASDGGSSADANDPCGAGVPVQVSKFAFASESALVEDVMASAAGDFDGDGQLDVVIGTRSGVGVLLGNGDGTLRAEVKYGTGTGLVPSVATGDFDRNGKLDIVAASYDRSVVSVFLNKGDGTFQAAVDYAADMATSSVTTGDLDGDGKIDIAAAPYNGYVVDIMLGVGDGTFRAAVHYLTVTAMKSTSRNPATVAAGDFNGDTKVDLVLASSKGVVNIFLGRGDGTLQLGSAYEAISPNSNGTGVAVGDWNRDGRADLAVTGSGVGLLIGNGDGTFRPAIGYVAGHYANAIASGDWNGDGALDLVLAGSTSRVVFGDGRGGLQASAFVDPEAGWAVAAGDWNSDGKLDLVMTVLNRKILRVFLGDGGTPSDAGVCPIDRMDAGTPATDAGGGADAGPCAGDGGMFQAAVGYDVHTPGLSSYPAGIATGDWNGDGKTDLATANYTATGTITILIGNGSGIFVPTVHYRVGDFPRGLVTGDWNSDGKLDLAVSNKNSNGTISTFLGNGDGTFQTAVASVCMAWPGALVAGDWNRDGKLDLAAAGDTGVTALLGNGDGTFQPGNTTDTWGFNSQFDDSLVAGDWNRDGIPDVALAHRSGSPDKSVLDIRRGDGAGRFGAPDRYPIVFGTRSIATGDWNGDGYADLICVNATQEVDINNVVRDVGDVSLFLGRSGGTFVTPNLSPTRNRTPLDGVMTGDWNADGKADLAITDRATHDLKIHLGNGDATFQSAVSFGAGTAPSSMAAADLDGDGLVDLAVGDASQPFISVLLHTSRACGGSGP